MYSESDDTTAEVEVASHGFYEAHHQAQTLVPLECILPYSVQIGESSMRFEPPDICLVSYIGDLDDYTVSRMNAALERVAKRIGYIYMLVNLGDVRMVSNEAKAGGLRGMHALDPRATAVFGASLHLRVIAGLITKAASLIDARVRGPVCFFAGEQEARAWLSTIRSRMGARPPRERYIG